MKSLKWITCFLIIGTSSCAIGQPEGCTDINALNFDANAVLNDGSCLYPFTSYIPEKVSELPNTVKETSGLIKLENGFWTHNDSGNSPELYLIDSLTYDVVRSVYIKNYSNIDWEELTHNATHVFIGDFGNNNGTRSNLKVLRFDKSLLLDNSIDTIEVDEIQFSYPDQTSFGSSNDHNFDCEAFVFFNDSLQLFSKNRGNEYTKHYTLPSTTGSYTAILKDSCLVEGQITGAHIQGDTLIALIGYNPNSFYEPFIFLLWDFQGDDFFGGHKRRINLGTVLDMGQNEAIHFTGDYSGYITSEEITQLSKSAAIYAFGIAHLFESELAIFEPEKGDSNSLKVYPNPTKGKIIIEASENFVKEAFLIDQQGKIVYHRAYGSQGKKEAILKVQKVTPGIYFLQIKYTNEEVVVKKITIN